MAGSMAPYTFVVCWDDDGAQEGQTHVTFGVVEYWVRLVVPMEQALRLYKERSKALGYIESNLKHHQQQLLQPLDAVATKRPDDNINNLIVVPSPYFVYRFFDFADYDSSIIHSSNDPVFEDRRVFPVYMTSQFHQYLLSQNVSVAKKVPRLAFYKAFGSRASDFKSGLTTDLNAVVDAAMCEFTFLVN
ncbi:hypothetical protein HELRODRAFT_176355 [Helobdella robusta]|uniref:Uncharacterized protein n=1 Tax=Helobdella robusta TaxID=6412 RepID=T1FAF6_HELRO|nr:hypothetical protein HELRODRAFT_176355 [Helobdella robusta]ESO00047.1 hypothetical protein HELRODRAFT_176355 [Helobdella robusta]